MVKRSKGFLSKKTRKMVRKRKITVSEMVRSFNVGDTVAYCPQATVSGRPHLRYRSRHGIIREARGRGSYVVEIKDGGKTKQLIANVIHLKSA
ncbi:50S ribosomal protein L21e [Candidatus Micrarchaeota archaeon]|nr:50S ribosomal protein L21e [Candidatus Micrarchaeota archaeon]